MITSFTKQCRCCGARCSEQNTKFIGKQIISKGSPELLLYNCKCGSTLAIINAPRPIRAVV